METETARPIGQVLAESSPKPLPTSPATIEAAQAKDAAILAKLTELSLLYWRPDYSPGEAKLVLGMYLDDLREFAVKDIDHAIQTYRRNPENKFFPHPGALRGICETPPAWWTFTQAKWLKECRTEAAKELAKKEAALLAAQGSGVRQIQ